MPKHVKPVRLRFRETVSNVGTSESEVSFTVPVKGIIKRYRVFKDGGSGTTVASEVRETSGGTDEDVVLAYSATAFASMDSEEDLYYEVTRDRSLALTDYGTLYVAVTADTGSNTDMTIEIVVEPI